MLDLCVLCKAVEMQNASQTVQISACFSPTVSEIWPLTIFLALISLGRKESLCDSGEQREPGALQTKSAVQLKVSSVCLESMSEHFSRTAIAFPTLPCCFP